MTKIYLQQTIFKPTKKFFGAFLICLLYLAPVTTLSAQEKTILDSTTQNHKNSDNQKEDIIHQEITDNEPITQNEYFIKINDEVIPLDIDYFSAKKTILKKTSNKNYHPEIENIQPCFNLSDFNQIIQCHLSTSFQENLSLKKYTVFEINKKQLEEYLTNLNNNIKRDPQNVELRADENGEIKVIKPEKNGYELDLPEIMNNPLKYFAKLPKKKTIELPLKITKAKLRTDNYRQLGLKEKIGHGESNFAGSPKNRIHNIHNATDKFIGVIIPPNETFSFVKTLGPVDASTGYKEELVIKNNKTIPEFGGGVCQVSTTLFRAAVNTGLKITERRNHAYPVQYYSPQGTDATVYIPKPDLQFVNDTPGYILLQPHIENTILSFDIFGTSDGRQVETEGPTLVKRTPDGGKKYVWWQIIKDKDGNEIAKNGFWSFYQNAAKFH